MATDLKNQSIRDVYRGEHVVVPLAAASNGSWAGRTFEMTLTRTPGGTASAVAVTVTVADPGSPTTPARLQASFDATGLVGLFHWYLWRTDVRELLASGTVPVGPAARSG